MDVQYRIFEFGVVSGSAPSSLPLAPDSKALPEIFATNARGSCGVDPGPVVRLRAVTLSASPKGDGLYGVRKRLVFERSSMFSTFAMLSFTALAVSR